MSFVAGQWVECVDDSCAKDEVANGSFYRVTAVSGSGHFVRIEGLAYELASDRFRPVEWQVGRTYKTTLEGVTVTIADVRGEIVRALAPYWRHKTEAIRGATFDSKTGRLRGVESRNDVPHLTPYLADPEPSKSEDEAQGIAAIVGKWSGDESDEEIEREIESVLSDGACEVVGRYVIVQDADNPALFGVRDTHEMNTAWTQSMATAQRVLEDARAGKKHLWSWAKDVASEPSRYHRTIHGVTLDLCDIAEAWGVDSHRIFHAVKKLIMAGRRGHKDREQDLREAITSIESELRKMKGGA